MRHAKQDPAEDWEPENLGNRGILVEIVGPRRAGKRGTAHRISARMPANLRVCVVSNDTSSDVRLLLSGFSDLEARMPLGHPARRALFSAALLLLDEDVRELLLTHHVVFVEHHIGHFAATELAFGDLTDTEWLFRRLSEPDLTVFLADGAADEDPRFSAALNELAGSRWMRITHDSDSADNVASTCVEHVLGCLQHRKKRARAIATDGPVAPHSPTNKESS